MRTKFLHGKEYWNVGHDIKEFFFFVYRNTSDDGIPSSYHCLSILLRFVCVFIKPLHVIVKRHHAFLIQESEETHSHPLIKKESIVQTNTNLLNAKFHFPKFTVDCITAHL